MSISTQGIVLAWGATEYGLSKKIAIKDFPDLGGTPEMLPITTFDDEIETFILGIQSANSMEFSGNYTKAEYLSILAGANAPMYYALYFKDQGVARWQGQHTVFISGAGTNEVVNLKIVVAPSTKPTFTDMGMVLVTSTDAAGVSDTSISVWPAAPSGYKYMYQLGASITAPLYEADVSGWTDLATNPDDIASTNGHKIGVALVATATEEALAYGETTVVIS